MTVDNNKNELDNFTEDAPAEEVASWSSSDEALEESDIDEGEVEFFSLPESKPKAKKGSKRFSKDDTDDSSKEISAELSEDEELDLALKAEIEGEISASNEEVGLEVSDKDAPVSVEIDWGSEAEDNLNDIELSEQELVVGDDFEADMLLIDAHDELEKELNERKLEGEVSEESVEADSDDSDAPVLSLETQSEEDLESKDDAETEAAQINGATTNQELSLTSKVEAIIFAAPRPLKVGEVLEILGEESTSKDVSDAISELVSFYKNRQGGFTLEAVRGGYQFQSSLGASTYMQRMFSSRPRPISRAAQETLAIIAYRQPVTRADIEFIRGVDAGSIVKNLLDRGLIKAVGRKEDAGRPILFGTTDEFLQIYGLQDLSELPPLESFQPSNDLVKAGMDLIEDQDKPVHEGDFVGDHDAQAAEAAEMSEINDTEPAENAGNSVDSMVDGASLYEVEQNSDMTEELETELALDGVEQSESYDQTEN
jgi:segregation and condensation protein B